MPEIENTKDATLQRLIAANEEALIQQSRSFSLPILKLDGRFKTPIMVQYNLNKSIDTIEDSVVLETGEKIDLIQAFCRNLLKGTWSPEIRKRMLQVTPADESFVFSNHEQIIRLYNTLSPEEQSLSKKWTLEMADGMCRFLTKAIDTPKDLNDYCYYVAGSVGLYLTALLQLKGTAVTEKRFQALRERAVSFGTFLQKLNIIRDFIEDKTDRNRTFWPRVYLEQGKNPLEILNRMTDETYQNDVPQAIDYYAHLPAGNESFEYFIRFILASGIEYLHLLKNNQSVFSKKKVKLPRTFIEDLYTKLAALSSSQFLDYCRDSSAFCQQS